MLSRDQIAQELVDYHIVAEDEIIYACQYTRRGGDRVDEPVKLLEVSRVTVPAGISPVYFGPNKRYPLPVVIIEITELEFHGLEEGSVKLPEGWDVRHVLHQRAA